MTAAGIVVLLAFGASTSFQSAEQAFAAGDYERALPLIERALKEPLSRAEQVRAHEMAATVHGAFGRTNEAIAHYRSALSADATYAPPAHASPKIHGLFAEAQRQHRAAAVKDAPTSPVLAPHLAVADAPLVAPAPERTETVPLYRRWWLWAAVGGVVAASVATAVAIDRAAPPGPVGNLGSERL